MKTINTKENKITLHTKDTIIEEDIVVNFEGGSGGSGGGEVGDGYKIRLTENIGLTIPTMKISGATSIDWGDGTVDTNLTHTYADYGDYVIKISGMTQITSYFFGSSSSLYNYSLLKCYLGGTVTSIGNNAFSGCYSLTSVVIPESVTSIEYYAFKNCYSIIHYVLKCSSVPTLSSNNAFTNINKAAIIWVKDELVESYKTATNWSEYATYIKPISAMPEKLKEELGVL